MTTWWVMPKSQKETCWTTSVKPTATSLQSTLRSTSSTCAEPGIPSIQWRPSSSRFKTALTIRRQEAYPSVPRSRSMLGMKNICNRALHERLSPLKRETSRWKNLDSLQIPLRSRSPSAQANEGGNHCPRRIPLS
jgi:hypothetical protein